MSITESSLLSMNMERVLTLATSIFHSLRHKYTHTDTDTQTQTHRHTGTCTHTHKQLKHAYSLFSKNILSQKFLLHSTLHILYLDEILNSLREMEILVKYSFISLLLLSSLFSSNM